MMSGSMWASGTNGSAPSAQPPTTSSTACGTCRGRAASDSSTTPASSPTMRWTSSTGPAYPGRRRSERRAAARRRSSAGSGARPLERERRADVGVVRERLRHVAERLAARRVELLGEQADVVGGRARAREGALGLVQPPLVRQALGEPEGAGQEGPLALVRGIAADEAVGRE